MKLLRVGGKKNADINKYNYSFNNFWRIGINT